MSRIRINLSLDEDIYRKFQEHCKERGMVPSRKIELYIVEELKKRK